MKKLLFPFSLVTVLFFTGCGATGPQEVKASLPAGYKIISESEDKRSKSTFYELQHIETGCVILYTYNNWQGTNTSETQWGPDGKPYCPEVN